VVREYIHTSKEHLPTIVNNLLNDVEAEVRNAAASHITDICKNFERNIIIEIILPTLQKLSNDSSDFVRATIASEMSALTIVLGNEDTVTHVLPILLCLLRDENTTVILSMN
jgi:serine/threonine-protein phosphatase 2A regulatory subunit A